MRKEKCLLDIQFIVYIFNILFSWRVQNLLVSVVDLVRRMRMNQHPVLCQLIKPLHQSLSLLIAQLPRTVLLMNLLSIALHQRSLQRHSVPAHPSETKMSMLTSFRSAPLTLVIHLLNLSSQRTIWWDLLLYEGVYDRGGGCLRRALEYDLISTFYILIFVYNWGKTM